MDLHLNRRDVVVPVPVDPSGVAGPTRGQARGRAWRRTSPNRFVPSDVDGRREPQRIVEAVAGAPPGAAATGWSALHWQGARWFSGRKATGEALPVLLAVGDAGHLAPRDGVTFCYDWLFEGDVVEHGGLPITRPERSVCAAALRAPTLVETVQVIDMAAADDLVSVAELAAYFTRLRGRPHTLRLGAAIALANENAWSPVEVTMRLRWLEERRIWLPHLAA